MVSGPELDPKMMTIEAPKTREQIEMEKHRLQVCQSTKLMPTMMDEPLYEH